MKKRILSLALCLVLGLSLVPTGALAAGVVQTGTCGDNLTWTLDDAGVLTISGEGPMADMVDQGPPWPTAEIKCVIIKNGVTSIGSYAFVYLLQFD